MQKQGADIPDLPEEFSEEMSIIYTSCLAKETWDRPSAAQIRDYAEACCRGQKPEITWNYQSATPEVVEAKQPEPAQPEPVQQQPVQPEPVNPAPAPAPAPTGGKAGSNNLKGTVALGTQSAPTDNADLPPIIGAGLADAPSDTLVPTSGLSIAWWWFIVMAVLGFAAGIAIKMFFLK